MALLLHANTLAGPPPLLPAQVHPAGVLSLELVAAISVMLSSASSSTGALAIVKKVPSDVPFTSLFDVPLRPCTSLEVA